MKKDSLYGVEKSCARKMHSSFLYMIVIFCFRKDCNQSFGVRWIMSFLPGPFDTSVIGKPISFSISST